jgi:hypothetical protein
MVTLRSTTYCDESNCKGHVEVIDYPGQRLVLTDDPALPLALIPDDTEEV